jgi:hypothetical protein
MADISDGGAHAAEAHVIHVEDSGHSWDHYGPCPCPDNYDHHQDNSCTPAHESAADGGTTNH